MIPLAKNVIGGLRLLVNHFNDSQYMSWALKDRNKLSQFQNRHLGEKCFIIGNGPSLNQMDLKLLNSHTCFGLNKIYLHPDFDQINISYHASVNPLVIEQSAEHTRKIKCPSFLSYRACDGNLPEGHNYYSIMTTGGPQRFAFDLFDTISEGGTITYIALQIAYFMGFSEVYLIGVDHNFSVDGKPNEKQLMEGTDPNHFHPDYFSGQEWHLPDLEASEIAYRLARYYFHAEGRNIYDATVDGHLEVFERISYEQALANCRQSME